MFVWIDLELDIYQLVYQILDEFDDISHAIPKLSADFIILLFEDQSRIDFSMKIVIWVLIKEYGLFISYFKFM